jgi:hypothetical protein
MRDTAVKNDRLGIVFRQLPFDIPNQLLPLLLVGFHRLPVDQFVYLWIAVSTVVVFRTADVILIE